MTCSSIFRTIALGFVVLCAQATSAFAADIKVLVAIGIKEVFEELIPMFERASGHKLVVSYATLGAAVKQVQDGEVADVVVIPRPGIDTLSKGGKIAKSSISTVAKSGIGLAVRKGAPKPDISTPDALKEALLTAKSITYANPAHGGASGVHFAKVLERLGIVDQMQAKTVFLPKAGPVAALVVEGRAEIAIQQLQELAADPGVEIVGPLPGDLQLTIVFSGAIIASSKVTEAAQALLNFTRTPEATRVIKAKGLEPI